MIQQMIISNDDGHTLRLVMRASRQHCVVQLLNGQDTLDLTLSRDEMEQLGDCAHAMWRTMVESAPAVRVLNDHGD